MFLVCPFFQIKRQWTFWKIKSSKGKITIKVEIIFLKNYYCDVTTNTSNCAKWIIKHDGSNTFNYQFNQQFFEIWFNLYIEIALFALIPAHFLCMSLLFSKKLQLWNHSKTSHKYISFLKWFSFISSPVCLSLLSLMSSISYSRIDV